MASKKRKPAVKHKKTTVKKHKSHKVLGKKVLVEEQPQKQEIKEAAPSEPQAPVVSTEPTTSTESTNPLGSPVVASSGVLQESPKEQESQPEKQSPETPQSQPQPQLSEQTADALQSQPEPAVSSIPSSDSSQDSSSFSGVVRDQPEQGTEQQNIDEPKKKRLWIAIAIIIIVLVLIGGALWYFRENVMKRAPVKDEITPVPSILKNTPTPASKSAALEIDFSEYSIQVLNGSGISGVAGETKEILESEEFYVEEIGNADSANYEGTIIKAKKEVSSEFLDKLKGVLEESYILDPSEELEDSEDVDVVIIIGSSK